MKFNFRKIASVLASTVMLSSTVALAAAANYPSPFVSNGVADVAVVYGANAPGGFDSTAALDITANLNGKLIASSGAASTVSGGDFVKLEESKDKFNLGDKMTDLYTSLDSEDLSVVLASGTYLNLDNKEYDYDQKIELGGLTLAYFVDSNDDSEVPIIGFDLAQGDHVLNYTLDFEDSVAAGTDFADLETTDLTMLGRTYYVSSAENVAGKGIKLELLDSANSAYITYGESKTIDVAGISYDVSITFIDDDEVLLNVNGVETNKKLKEGDVFKVDTDLYVGVKQVLYDQKESGVSRAEISLGSGKIMMENSEEIEVNEEPVSDNSLSKVTAFITNSSTDIEKIVLVWNIDDDDALLTTGSDIVLPGFETIKLSMGGFVESRKEQTSIKPDGDDSIELSTEVTDGSVSLNLLYSNATGTGIAGLGKDANSLLVTSSTSEIILDEDTLDWFVVSWLSGDEAESYVLKIDSIDGSNAAKNTTTLKTVATGSSKSLALDIGETDAFGEINLKLNAANEDTGVINLTASAAGGTGTVSLSKIYTKEGMKIQLPVNSATAAGDGVINVTANPTTHKVNFTEAVETDGDLDKGDSFTATIGFTSDAELQVSDVSVTDLKEKEGSDVYVGYVVSDMATKTTLDTGADPDTLDVEYHGAESYADVFVSEVGAAVTAEGGSKILAITDAESTSAKNLVVVGGSCVNSVAADLLGGALCGAEFEAKTGVGAGSFLIETFARDGGGVATLVAGYNAQDSINGAKYLTTQTVDTSAGKKYKGTTATSATLVLA